MSLQNTGVTPFAPKPCFSSLNLSVYQISKPWFLAASSTPTSRSNMKSDLAGKCKGVQGRLEREWRKASSAGVGVLVVSSWGMLRLTDTLTAFWWSTGAFLTIAYVLGSLWVLLPFNCKPDEETPLPTLGAGTWLTLLRGFLIGLLGGFLFLFLWSRGGRPPWLAWTPGLIYLLAGAADFADGYLARITDHVTRLGESLDRKIDALGLLIASLSAICMDRLPPSYIAAGLAYYLFRAGIWYRKKRGKTVVPLKPRPGSRVTAGFQMGFVGAALLPLLPARAMALASWVFMTPLLLGFLRDWLVVSARVEADSPQIAAPGKRRRVRPSEWLPLFTRAALLLSGPSLIRQCLSTEAGVPACLQIPLFLMLLTGTMGRGAAFPMCFLAASGIEGRGVFSPAVVLFAGSLILMLVGTGPLSIWRPEERLLLRRAGESGPAQPQRRGIDGGAAHT